MRKFVGVLILICLHFSGISQTQTVGVFVNDSSAYDGYTLLGAILDQKMYLIDNCGREIHSWESEYNGGLVSYLLEDGSLLRSGRQPSSTFSGGGVGGIIQHFDWEGNIIWQYEMNTPDYINHHDLELLPNGNILVVAWEYKSRNEAILAGRDPANSQDGVWMDMIVELRPIGTDSAEWVWEWHLWDHLIQDRDSARANFGVVGDHPERVDFNFTDGWAIADWTHNNTVDYNAEWDQIILSPRHLHEIWIVDHSTTTAQAATDSGGNYGMGGGLLYRWGNPESYDHGINSDQELFAAHDPHWIDDSLPNGGKIMLFNNGGSRPTGSYSSVDILTLPADSAGNYPRPAGQPWGPAALDWTYTAPIPQTWYSPALSGAQQLPNGNVIVCDGENGRAFEVDSTGNMVWEYINPIGVGGPVSQGAIPISPQMFRVYKYGPGYGAFQGRDLTPGEPLEKNPFPLIGDCATISIEDPQHSGFQVYPNPVEEELTIENIAKVPLNYVIRDVWGREMVRGESISGKVRIFTTDWSSGIYFLSTEKSYPTTKIIKR